MNFEDSEGDRKRTHEMFIKQNRVESFKDWVFDKNCECTPEKVGHDCILCCMVLLQQKNSATQSMIND